MGKTLYRKVWDAHSAGTLPDGRTQLFIATMYLHEVTSPQAFAMLRELGLPVLHPERLFATVDHIIPTDDQCEPFADPRAAAMLNELRRKRPSRRHHLLPAHPHQCGRHLQHR